MWDSLRVKRKRGGKKTRSLNLLFLWMKSSLVLRRREIMLSVRVRPGTSIKVYKTQKAWESRGASLLWHCSKTGSSSSAALAAVISQGFPEGAPVPADRKAADSDVCSKCGYSVCNCSSAASCAKMCEPDTWHMWQYGWLSLLVGGPISSAGQRLWPGDCRRLVGEDQRFSEEHEDANENKGCRKATQTAATWFWNSDVVSETWLH